MPKINVLPRAVSELIAAGEVIERPASIVKELVENSIDAGASVITVEIQNGGIRYLRITDNGCGIAPEDAEVAFERHATSKVESASDLETIATLGFRGEALASIAAVAHVELLTKAPGLPSGTLVKISASRLEEVCEAGCPDGTTLVVRDVFYNVPARLKFLKKDVSEGNAVETVLQEIALSHPEIAMKFLRDGKTAFHTPGDGKQYSVIYTLYGREFSQNLLPVEYELNGVGVKGFIGKPMSSRSNRGMQHFFVNGRYTKTKTGGVALEEAYRSTLMTGKFPVCVLELSVPYDQVDVNVHPAKIEVRFVSEKAVFDAVYFAAKSALHKDDQNVLETPAPAKPSVLSPFADPGGEQETLHTEKPWDKALKPPVLAPSSQGEIQDKGERAELESPPGKVAPSPCVPLSISEKPGDAYMPLAVSDGGACYHRSSKPVPSGEEPPRPAPASEGSQRAEQAPEPIKELRVRLIGEIFSTYILAQAEETFVMVDKHAAHERILYNRLKENGMSLEKQFLLSPLSITLTKQEHECVLEQQKALEGLGFGVEDFGGNEVLLRAVPAVTATASAKEMFLEIAGALLSKRRQPVPTVVEDILHRIACRSAVKGGDQNSPEELLSLVKRVLLDDSVRYCPHGRPVIVTYTRMELEKLFGRIPQ